MIRRQSMHIGKNLAGSVGSYLPGAITEIFEPSRDFAHLKLPSAGVQSVIALSKYVFRQGYQNVHNRVALLTFVFAYMNKLVRRRRSWWRHLRDIFTSTILISRTVDHASCSSSSGTKNAV